MGSPGGATLVAVWIAEALMHSYRVTLYATGRELDLAELNRLYGTHLESRKLTVKQWPRLPLWPRSGIRQARLLQLAALARKLNRHPEEYDLYVSATNEVVLPSPHLQYVHFPQHHWSTLQNEFSGSSLSMRVMNELLYRAMNGVRRFRLENSCVLTNSCWTRNVISRLYGTQAQVVYPPVCLSATNPTPWEKRDFAFVTVGRFDRRKRLFDAISIVEKLRERFPLAKLHVVGFGRGRHRSEILELAARKTSFVIVHENISRRYLANLLCASQFALHCTPNEHFGLAPAEAAASGCLVFVHNSGGQVDIVDRDSDLLFTSVQECCRKIAFQIENPILAEKKASRYQQLARDRFCEQRFTEYVRRAVDHLLLSHRRNSAAIGEVTAV